MVHGDEMLRRKKRSTMLALQAERLRRAQFMATGWMKM
jgi:hypothetical protein